MTIYSGRISQLLQGVSQQPPDARAEGQVGEQINCLSDIVDGLRRRRGSEVIADISAGTFNFSNDMGYHSYDRGDGSESYLICIDDAGAIKVIDLADGSLPTVTNNCVTYLALGDAYKNLKFHTIADTTFIVNTAQTVAMDSDKSDALDNEYLIYCKRANYGKIYQVIVDGTVRATYETPATVTITTTTQNKQLTLSTEDIITELYNDLVTWAGFATIERKNDIIHVTHASNVTVEVTDANHGTDLYTVRNNVNEYADLPMAAPKDYRIKISGLGETEWDDFWVKWEPESGSATNWYGPGTWQECIAPDTFTTIDGSTMPVKLVRQANGSFICSAETWGQRASGDEDTNPDPSFIASTIQDIGSYQNRFYTLTEENVVMSRAFDQLQFFSESVAQAADDDPVDSASSDNQITNLQHAVVFNGDLVMFSNNAQFVHRGDVAVNPATFAVATTSKFNADPDSRPVVVGHSIVFPDRGATDLTNVWEYRQDTISDTPICESITKHLPKYITGYPYKAAADTSTGMLFMHMGKEIVVLQTYYKDMNRAQLSWHKWHHAGYDETGHNILAIAVQTSTLYILVEHGTDEYRLERIDLNVSYATPYSEYEIFLDSIYTDQVTSGTYVIGDREYTRRVPQRLTDDDIVYVQGDNCDNPGMRLVDYAVTGGYVYFKQTSSTGYILQGKPFESFGTITNPYIRDSAGRPFTQETILDSVVYNLVKSGYLELTVGHAAGTDYTQVYNGIILNHWQYKIGQASLLDTRVDVPVRDSRDLVTLSFSSDHHLGFAISSVDWQARMTARGRRSQ